MRVLVTGPESSGTKMVSALLMRAGASVEHRTPRPRVGKTARDPAGFDAVVVVVRNGHACARSMVENHHASDGERSYDLGLAYEMIPEALGSIFSACAGFEPVHVVTYEALIHEPEALPVLCRGLGLPEEFEHDPMGDANAKHYGSDLYFRDPRPLEQRA